MSDKNGMTLVRLRYKTKEQDDLVSYAIKGMTVLLPVVYVYEHPGSREKALTDFMPLKSFVMAETGDSFIAFPISAYSKVMHSIRRIVCRVESGRVSGMESVCSICRDRLKKALSNCEKCDSLRKVRQLSPTTVIDIRKNVEDLEYDEK